MNGKSLLFGIVTGVVVGGITTLVSTPKSGQEMKQLLRNNYEQITEIMQKGKKESLAIKEQIKQTAKISSSTLKSVSTDLKVSVDDWRKDVEPTLNQLKMDIDELQETIKKSTQN